EGERQDEVRQEGDAVAFRLRAHANPNNATAAMQGIALRARLGPDARLRLALRGPENGPEDGQEIDIPAGRLLGRAMSGNLGAIDTPAWRLHPLPAPADWQWRGRVEVEP